MTTSAEIFNALLFTLVVAIAVVTLARFSLLGKRTNMIFLIAIGIYLLSAFFFSLYFWMPEPLARPDGTLSRMVGIAVGLAVAYFVVRWRRYQ